MKQTDLIHAIADRLPAGANVSKTAVQNILIALANVAQEALANGDDVTIPGIAKLTIKERAARTGRNPRTGETVAVPAKRLVRAKFVKALRDRAEG